MGKIRVLLVDDHALLREGLRALLDRYPDLQVIGEAQNGEEAIAQVQVQQPDVVLMDIAMPGINGLEATRIIRQQYPRTRVLVLTQHEDRQYVMSLLKAGASGYVLKRALGKDLVSALRTVAQGEGFMYPSVTCTVLEQLQRSGTPQDKGGLLTPREKEILSHIVHGATNPQIASKLSLSVKTVDWHRVNLMNKLGVHSVADLVRYALQNGLAD
ncbi:MAG TPA: response regulator transcription factor [Anaerolineae bacterium]